MLAQKQPAQAADMLAQRVKALVKAGEGGHRNSAQFLELLSPEGSSLLERAEEVYTSREYLLDMKIKLFLLYSSVWLTSLTTLATQRRSSKSAESSRWDIAMSGVGLYHLDEESSNETMSPSFLEAVGSLHQPRSPPLLQVWFIHPGYGG